MWGRQRYEYAVRDVRVARGTLTIGFTTFALSNIVRVEVVDVATRPRPIGPWANQVAYPFCTVAAILLLLRVLGAEGIPWEAALATASAGLAWPLAHAWQSSRFWDPVWRLPVFALELVTATQHVHRICAHDSRHLAALAGVLGSAMNDPSVVYHGSLRVISNADALHTLETGKDSMVR